jgi:hypothetical protein
MNEMHSTKTLLAATLLALAPSIAMADVVQLPIECPRGQMPVNHPGCPGHGSGATECGPAYCANDTACGEGQRCVEVPQCFETVELRCMSGDGRNPDSMREYVTSQDQERGPCGAGDVCPAGATCRHLRQCRAAPAPAPIAAPPSPATAPRAEPVEPAPSTCAIGRANIGSTPLLLVAIALLGAARRRR